MKVDSNEKTISEKRNFKHFVDVYIKTDIKNLLNRAREIAHKIAKGPNLIYSSIKEVLRETENVKEQPAFKTLRSLKTVNKVYRSKDLVEGATSFVKKSKPKWKGE